MIDRETKNRLADFFTGPELAEYLIEGGFISLSDMIDALEPEIEEALDDLEELMNV